MLRVCERGTNTVYEVSVSGSAGGEESERNPEFVEKNLPLGRSVTMVTVSLCESDNAPFP